MLCFSYQSHHLHMLSCFLSSRHSFWITRHPPYRILFSSRTTLSSYCRPCSRLLSHQVYVLNSYHIAPWCDIYIISNTNITFLIILDRNVSTTNREIAYPRECHETAPW